MLQANFTDSRPRFVREECHSSIVWTQNDINVCCKKSSHPTNTYSTKFVAALPYSPGESFFVAFRTFAVQRTGQKQWLEGNSPSEIENRLENLALSVFCRFLLPASLRLIKKLRKFPETDTWITWIPLDILIGRNKERESPERNHKSHCWKFEVFKNGITIGITMILNFNGLILRRTRRCQIERQYLMTAFQAESPFRTKLMARNSFSSISFLREIKVNKWLYFLVWKRSNRREAFLLSEMILRSNWMEEFIVPSLALVSQLHESTSRVELNRTRFEKTISARVGGRRNRISPVRDKN